MNSGVWFCCEWSACATRAGWHIDMKVLCGRCSFWHMGLCDGSCKSCWVDRKKGVLVFGRVLVQIIP